MPLSRLADTLRIMNGSALTFHSRSDPAPRHELISLVDTLGEALLAELAGVHPSSVREREIPDVVADRLHLLALAVGDLLGAYNELGVRRWFERRRSQLGGEAPRDLLAGEWSSRDPGPRRVRELAAALRSSPAT